MRKKVIAILLSLTMTAAMLAGCGNSGSTTSDSASEPAQETAQDESSEATEAEEETAEAGENETAENEAGGVKSRPEEL